MAFKGNDVSVYQKTESAFGLEESIRAMMENAFLAKLKSSI